MRPSPDDWGTLTQGSSRVIELDWRAGLAAGDSISAGTAQFTSKPAGLTFADVTIVGTKTQATMSHPGALQGAAKFQVYARITVAGTGEVIETDPPITVRYKPGGTYT